MKPFVVFAASLSLVVPTVLGQLPNCASACLATHYSSSSCTNSADLECLCNSKAFVTAAIECIRGTCSAQDANTSIEYLSNLCHAQGVTVSTSVAPRTATTSATVTPMSTATTSATVTPMSTATTSATETPMSTATISTTVTPMSTGNACVTTVVETVTSTVLETPTNLCPTELSTTYQSSMNVSGTATGTSIPRNTSSPTVPRPPVHTDEGAATKMGVSFGAMALAMAGFFVL